MHKGVLGGLLGGSKSRFWGYWGGFGVYWGYWGHFWVLGGIGVYSYYPMGDHPQAPGWCHPWVLYPILP